MSDIRSFFFSPKGGKKTAAKTTAKPKPAASSSSSSTPTTATTKKAKSVKSNDKGTSKSKTKRQKSSPAAKASKNNKENDSQKTVAAVVNVTDSDDDVVFVAKKKSKKKIASKTKPACKSISPDDFFGGADNPFDTDMTTTKKKRKSKKTNSSTPPTPPAAAAAVEQHIDMEITTETETEKDKAKRKKKKKRVSETPAVDIETAPVKKAKTTPNTKASSTGAKDAVTMDTRADAAESTEGEKKKTPKKAVQTPQKKAAKIEASSDSKNRRNSNYYQMLHRQAPPNLGNKEYPEGEPGCLGGLTFVITGVLDSMERDDCKDYIIKYGGRVTGSVSGKTSYLIVGLEPGSKVAKAKAKNIEIIDEDGLLDLVRTRKESSMSAEDLKQKVKKQKAFANELKKHTDTSTSSGSTSSKSSSGSGSSSSRSNSKQKQRGKSVRGKKVDASELLWVDRHKPSQLQHLIGNQTNVGRISAFLDVYSQNRVSANRKFQRALLISGAPGIGKSTAASLVARVKGFEVVEFNASDVRNKNMLSQVLGDMSANKSVSQYFGSKKQVQRKGSSTCVVMDEVDGMSGNADRGGMQELLAIIRSTKVPIICICNDASLPKMRTLKTTAQHLVWRRPTAQQIAPRIFAIARAEGLQIDMPAINKITESVHGDIRQILNFLQMWKAGSDTASFSAIKQRLDSNGKDFDLGPFDVIGELFSKPNTSDKNWVNQRLNKYFVDGDMVSLMVAENYASMKPRLDPRKGPYDVALLEEMAKAADSIAAGDIINNTLRREGDFSLMPMHGAFSTIIPCFHMNGVGVRPMFPSWLGKYSSKNKQLRLMREISTLLSAVSASMGQDFPLDYFPMFRERLLKPLVEEGKEGIQASLQMMKEYGLSSEDLKLIQEMQSSLLKSVDLKQIQSKTKAAMTRAANAAGIKAKVARDEEKGAKKLSKKDAKGLLALAKQYKGQAPSPVKKKKKTTRKKASAKSTKAKAKPAAKKKKKKAKKAMVLSDSDFSEEEELWG